MALNFDSEQLKIKTETMPVFGQQRNFFLFYP